MPASSTRHQHTRPDDDHHLGADSLADLMGNACTESCWRDMTRDTNRCRLMAVRPQAGVRSHRVTVLSRLPVARMRPSGEKATALTTSVWPVRGWPRRRGWLRSVTSQRMMVRSPLAVAKVRPSGENTTEVTQPGPVTARPRRWGWLRTVKSHRMTELSRLPVAKARPSGEN